MASQHFLVKCLYHALVITLLLAPGWTLKCLSCKSCTPEQGRFICEAQGACECPEEADSCMKRHNEFAMAGDVAFRACADSTHFNVENENTENKDNATSSDLICKTFQGDEDMPSRKIQTCVCKTDYCNSSPSLMSQNNPATIFALLAFVVPLILH